MNFINPAGLLFAGIAIPIIALYLLKIRRRDLEISSTMLWQIVLKDRQANAPWQKLRRNLLLLLQLVILSGLVLAAARLAFPIRALATGSVVVLLDGSASMFTREETGQARFDQAAATVLDIAEDLTTGAEITVILAAGQPRILAAGASSPEDLAASLEQAAPDTGRSDWPSAIALAAGLGSQGSSLTYLIVSDGGIPDLSGTPLPGEVRYVPVGATDNNLAVEAFEARLLPGFTEAGAELFIRVANHGSQDRTAVLTIRQDEAEILQGQFSVAAGEAFVQTLPLSEIRQAIFTAGLRNVQEGVALDSFPLDDQAVTVMPPPTNRRVFLVSEGNLFLERLLLLLPNIQPLRVVPNDDGIYDLPEDRDAIFVLDGLIPGGETPPGDLLIIHPPENGLFAVGPEIEAPTAQPADHPIVRDMAWQDVHIQTTRQIEPPPWAEVLVQSDSEPLLFIGQENGRRVAVLGFDLHQTDLPLQVSFPILFLRLFEYLAPQQAVRSANGSLPNETVSINPKPGNERLEVRTPNGQTISIDTSSGEPVRFRDTSTPGLYTVTVYSPEGQESEYFAINHFVPEESQIAVRDEIQIGQRAVQPAPENQVANREAWGWLLLLALAFLLIEWLVYHQRLQMKTKPT